MNFDLVTFFGGFFTGFGLYAIIHETASFVRDRSRNKHTGGSFRELYEDNKTDGDDNNGGIA